jgi:hypothetical protein
MAVVSLFFFEITYSAPKKHKLSAIEDVIPRSIFFLTGL